jgi:hypothetical protein
MPMSAYPCGTERNRIDRPRYGPEPSKPVKKVDEA